MSEDKKDLNVKKQGPGMGMGPGRGPVGFIQKPKDFKATMKKLITYLRPFWISTIFVFVFAVASTVFAILSPRILGNMTNQIVSDYTDMKAYESIMSLLPESYFISPGTKGGELLNQLPQSYVSQIPVKVLDSIKNIDLSVKPQINFGILKSFAIELLILYVLSSIFAYIQGWIMAGVTQKISYRFRRDISEKINRLPLSYFDKKSFGDILSRITNDVDTVSQTLNQILTQIVTSFTLLIGILVMMFIISWQLTLVSLFLIPLSFFIIAKIVKKSQKYFKSQQDILGEINGHVEEMYSGHNVMRVFDGEERSIRKFEDLNGKLFGSAWKSQFLSGLMWPMMSFVGNLGFVGVSALGGWLAVLGKIRIGDIQAFIQYVNQFNQPIIQAANVANVLQSTAAAAERVFEFMEVKEEIKDKGENIEIEKVKGRVEFCNVEFGYSKDKPVIKNFSASIEPGQRVAIVGPTGAGKTTLVNLLMRFYDVDKGSIKIDGVDIRNINRSDVRKLFGMVLQDTWLFNGTIRNNISYGRADASEEEIVRAAKLAHVDHFIHALPNGYDMELNEQADNISQGEKQLLTIARAMLVNTSMLILDEATSSVDTRTEILIQEAMENLMKNKTSFVIAHRLSTIRNADLILVINDGNIVEQGTHEELLAKNGSYASLYNSQFV